MEIIFSTILFGSVRKQPDPDEGIMIITPVLAQFFIQSHTAISVSGNCFLEFDSAKEAQALLKKVNSEYM